MPQGPPKGAQGTPKGSILEHFSNTFAPQSSFWITFKQQQKHQQKQQQKRQELSNDKQQKQRQQHQQQQQQKQQQREHQHQRVHFEMLCSNNTCTDHPGSIQSWQLRTLSVLSCSGFGPWGGKRRGGSPTIAKSKGKCKTCNCKVQGQMQVARASTISQPCAPLKRGGRIIIIYYYYYYYY